LLNIAFNPIGYLEREPTAIPRAIWRERLVVVCGAKKYSTAQVFSGELTVFWRPLLSLSRDERLYVLNHLGAKALHFTEFADDFTAHVACQIRVAFAQV
jgi:hypothetical protein